MTSRALSASGAEPDWPMPEWKKVDPGEVGMDAGMLEKARDYSLTGGGSGYITRGGKLVLSWGDVKNTYDLKSTTKSIGVTALGLAIADGKIRLDDKVVKLYPKFGIPPDENAKTGWVDKVTVFHLATQTAGFEKPGGFQKLLFAPGTKWCYSDGGPNWLAECVTLVYRKDVAELMFERVLTPLGIGRKDLSWRNNSYRPAKIDDIPRHEFGSGISANVDAMARIGLLYLREGQWQDKQIIPKDFVAACRTTPAELKGLPVIGDLKHPGASDHYGLLWWNNNDGTLKDVPRDAFWSWGLFDSFIVVIPSLDIVVTRAGQGWKELPSGPYGKLAPFLGPIAASVKGQPAGPSKTQASEPPEAQLAEPPEAPGPKAPYTPSAVITRLVWAPKDTIVRDASDSDNWPMTWADDDHQYTAYGDGTGFKPKAKGKLSLGLARVEGPADKFLGVNIRSATAEQKGDGPSGKKASGMLCIGGTLHILVRNAKNAQLGWSADHGQTWTWADWRFTTSFGCPTFLNFGKDYAGARDEFVYVYSFDSDSAYKPSDRMVLARVPKDKVNDRDAYEFFVKLDEKGELAWDKDIARRGTVFEHKGRCYRGGVSYNAAVKRYLWVQIIPGTDSRSMSGLGIYDAPEPWGPWTTVFFTEQWDVGPGDSASFPTKWMSTDGKSLYLVFSGNDSFSVRRATLTLAEAGEEPTR